jgi:hypothetical protein
VSPLHPSLALACVALLGVMAAQEYLYKPLRDETISSGLTGPYHWWLDASYVLLALALVGAFSTSEALPLALISAVALIMTGATNTFGAWIDKHVADHSELHSAFTIIVFASALVLQMVNDDGFAWWLTVASIVLPAIAYLYFHFHPTTVKGVLIQASPAAEKIYVLMLCVWLISWSV